MNVDVDNFHQVRRYISENQLIKKSKFISLDLQFTGIKFDNNDKDRNDMFLNDKYQKMANIANRYSIIQVGLTFVVPEQEIEGGKIEEEGAMEKQMSDASKKQKQEKYIAYPYNFYVFPRDTVSHSPTISMQAGCVEFNTANSMDWNRWICKGITYIRLSQINKLYQYLQNSGSMSSVTVNTNTNTINSKLFVEIMSELNTKTKQYVEEIIKSCQNKQIGYKFSLQVAKSSVRLIRKAMERYADQKQINLMISTSNTNSTSQDEQEQIIGHQKSHPNIEHILSNSINLHVQIISQERRKQQQQFQKQKLLGFTLIFEQIWNSNKTIIGHNCLYDLLFVYSSFIDQLPREYQNFKKLLYNKKQIKNGNQEYKKIYDTKYLASVEEFDGKIFKKGTSLDKLYKYYEEKENKEKENKEREEDRIYPRVRLAQGFQHYDLTKPALHEAGFDSYLTAWVFLHLPIRDIDEGRLSIFKSYYYMNLRTLSDEIRKDVLMKLTKLKVFVIAVVLNNAYVPYEQLKTMRMNQGKLIRQQLFKQNLNNDTIVIDGFKQIFLSMKQISKTDILIRFLIGLKKNKLINSNNIMSLEKWVKMKSEVATIIATNTNSHHKNSNS